MDLFDIHQEMKNDCGDAQERGYGGDDTDYPRDACLKDAYKTAKCPCGIDEEWLGEYEMLDILSIEEDTWDGDEQGEGAYMEWTYRFRVECLSCRETQVLWGSHQEEY